MKKIKEKKIKMMNEISSLMSDSIATTIIDYSKISSLDLKFLRKKIQDEYIKAKVVKNNIFKKILKEKEKIELIQYITGQNLIIFSKKNITKSIKVIKEFNGKNEKFKIKAVYVYNKIFKNNDIIKIEKLKTQEEELAKLIQTIRTPLIKLIFLLQSIKNEKQKGV